jgi:nucleoside-diphosphate-sugar epimerase
MPNSTVLILGANGRFGRQALHAFSRAGWNVLAQMRRAPAQPLPDGVQALICDALDTRALLDACAQPIEVVVNALNPPYDQWQRMLPPLGNVYNFGREIGPVVGEDAPQRPGTSKAALRIALEQNMAQATAHGVRSVVIRAGDFIGGSGPGTWIDIAIARKLDRHRFVYPGPLDIQHAWAYLPDLARVFVAVAEHR